MNEQLRVLLPSGRVFTVVGDLRVTALPEGVGAAPVVFVNDTPTHVLDPRAVVLRDGVIVAEPRSIARDALAPWVRDWLDEHPEWPRIATEVGA